MRSLRLQNSSFLTAPNFIGRPLAEGGPDPVAALAQAFEGHHTQVVGLQGDVKSVRASVDELLAKFAALQVGGTSGGNPAKTAKAKGALAMFMRTGDPKPMAELLPQASLRTDSDPDGGYVVPDEIATSLVEVQRNISPMRRLSAGIVTTSSSYSQPVNVGGAGATWVGERQSRPETDTPQLADVTIPAHEIYANPAVTQKLLDDANIDIAEFLTNDLAIKFEEQEGAAFISGTGVNQPRGLLTLDFVVTADATRTFGKWQYVATGQAAALATYPLDTFNEVVYALKAGYRRNASWLMNSATAAVLSKLKDDQHNYIWQRSVAQGQPPTLLGYPVEFDENMPDIGANAYPVAFGDFKRGYLITDRLGVRVLRDPYTNKPYVHFYTTKRVGGAPMDTNAIKFIKIASS